MRPLLILAATAALAQVPYERIRDADKEPGSWLTYSRTYSGQRFSPLTQINASNASRLQVAWVFQSRGTEAFQTTPLVADGVMYLTEPPNLVKALDAATGDTLWTYTHTIPGDLRLCCSRVNRGVALLDDKVYYVSIDAHVIALDAKTGRKRWETEMQDHTLGYSSTNAPLAVKDKIITGIGGGEYGIRGFVDAYDAKTGKRVWRSSVIPGPGEPGFESWGGDSWKYGGGSTWVTGVFDPDSNTIYWGTGNPGPDWNGDVRPGDNLYTDSVLALDADTGKRKWHFQFTPHDTHDWDSCQTPILVDTMFRGAQRKMLATANRNAFYYVLDRQNGKYLQSKPFVKQTWAKGIDDDGRPMVLPNTDPTEAGTQLWPSLGGGTNWYSPSYSPKTRMFYVQAQERGALYFKGEAEYKAGQLFNGGGQRLIADEDSYGAVRALDVETGNLKWEYRTSAPAYAGVLSTAGDLVMSGTDSGEVYALNASTGTLLWKFKVGLAPLSAPITYMLNGKQYVAFAAGRSLFVFHIPG